MFSENANISCKYYSYLAYHVVISFGGHEAKVPVKK